MVIRTIRDIFTVAVDTIYIDEQAAYERARAFLQLVMPRYVCRLQYYNGKEPLFVKHRLDHEFAEIHARTVPPKSGGSIRHRRDRRLTSLAPSKNSPLFTETSRNSPSAQEGAARRGLEILASGGKKSTKAVDKTGEEWLNYLSSGFCIRTEGRA